MRTLFKQILKGNGIPVLQTLDADGETILSAGNIWTSAHARRIELSERGLNSGDVVCSEVGGFQSLVDFVACTIGGFVYVPVAPMAFAVFQHQIAACPMESHKGILLIDGQDKCAFYPLRLPAALRPIHNMPTAQLALLVTDPSNALMTVNTFTSEFIEDRLAKLSASLRTPVGGSRLSYSTKHYDCGFVFDLLLSIYNRQTVYVRSGRGTSTANILSEVLDLAVDDLVMTPSMLEAVARECQTLPLKTRKALASVRAHTGGQVLMPKQHNLIGSVFKNLFVESMQIADVSRPRPNKVESLSSIKNVSGEQAERFYVGV